MKYTILLLVLFVSSNILQAQELDRPPLLQTPDNWGSEFFSIPTGFAREMTVEGYEEATFPKGWGTVDSPQFWSYVFTWSINTSKPLQIADLEHNLDLYFDGLMHGREEPGGDPILPTNTLVLENSSAENLSKFIGKVRLFEGFRTKKMITLHMQIDQEFCETEQRAILTFRFSPKTYENPIWEDLNGIIPVESACTQ